MNEHRRASRKSLTVEFHAQDAEGAGELLFEGIDLSVGGAFIRSELLLEQDETLSVEFRVPGVNRLMRAEARVAWVRRFPEPGQEPGMGVQFLNMSEADRRVLEAYLAVLP
jgi:uncharacterized protein (TIGR02266 family)